MKRYLQRFLALITNYSILVNKNLFIRGISVNIFGATRMNTLKSLVWFALLFVSGQISYAGPLVLHPTINNIKYHIEEDRYNYEKGTAKVIGFEKGEMSSVQFPDSIEYEYYPPFWDTPLKGKAVVMKIEDGAFDGCTQLQSVSLPSTIKYIGSYAFRGCVNLTNVNTDKVVSIGGSSFQDCINLTNINTGRVEGIGGYAFSGCPNIKSLNLDNLRSLSDHMFSGSSLEEISLPNAYQQVYPFPSYCFSNCTKLKKVNIPKLQQIFFGMFEGCESLEEVVALNATTIKRQAFDGCKTLKVLNAPNVTTIERLAFLRCSGPENLTLPKVTNIGEYAFESSGIKSISLANLSEISQGTFYNATQLTSVKSPQVKIIGKSAFEGCISLNEVELTNAQYIGTNVFKNCTSLSGISLPSVETIGDYAFQNCNALERVYFRSKAGTPHIGSRTFGGCNKLREIQLDNIEKSDNPIYIAGNDSFEEYHYSNVLLLISNQKLRNLYKEDPIWGKFFIADEVGIHLYQSRGISYKDEIKTSKGQQKISGVVADGMTQLYFAIKDANGDNWTGDINQLQVKLLFNGEEAPEAITGRILKATTELPDNQRGFIYGVPDFYPENISTPVYNVEVRIESNKKNQYGLYDVLSHGNLTIMRPPALLIPDMNNASTLRSLKSMLVSNNLYKSDDIIEWIDPSEYDNRVDRYVKEMKKSNISDVLQKRYLAKGIVAPSCVIIGEGAGSLIGYLYAAQAPQYSVHSLIGISPTFGSPLVDKLPFYFLTPSWLKEYYQFESNSEVVKQALSSQIPSNINVMFFGGAIVDTDNTLDWKDTEYGDYSSTHLSHLRWIWEEVANKVLPRGNGSFAELSNNVFGNHANDGFFGYSGIVEKQFVILEYSQSQGWCGVKSETHHYKLPHNKEVLSSVAGFLKDFTGKHPLSRKNSEAANQLSIPSNNSIGSVGSRNIDELNMIQDAEKLDISAEFVPASNGIYVELNKQDEVENTSVVAYMGDMLLSVSHTESGLIKVPGYYDGEIEIKACGNYGSSVIVASSKINVTTSAELSAIVVADGMDVIGVGSEITPIFKGYWSDGSISYVTPELTADDDCVIISGSKITGQNEGNTLITASIGDVNTVFNINVEDNFVPMEINSTTITLPKEEIIGFPGEKVKLDAVVESEEDIDDVVSWSSADEKIAVVNNDGLVELVSPGETVVSATCNGAIAECRIIVKEIPIIGIELDKTEAEGYIGGTIQLTATVKPEDTTDDTTVTWASSDENVATVDENGLVSCLAEGETVITATCGEFSAECTVTVTDRPPFVGITSFELSATEVELALNFTYSLFGVFTPENATDTELEWSTSNPDVARVYQGVVYGIVPGEAVITAKTTDGSNLSASCKFTIVSTSGIEGTEGDAVKVNGMAGVITVKGATVGATVEVYSMNGACVAVKTVESSVEELAVATSGIYVVRVGGKTFKVAL